MIYARVAYDLPGNVNGSRPLLCGEVLFTTEPPGRYWITGFQLLQTGEEIGTLHVNNVHIMSPLEVLATTGE